MFIYAASDSGLEDEAIDYVPSLQLGDDLGSDERQSAMRDSPAVHEVEHTGTVTDKAHAGESQKNTYAPVVSDRTHI